ncbi:hypothetical protein ACBQ16_10935 [Halopseudomonas bauzanensis]|uniref:hypothetical protein n=1 Tax=Halopseudomonas bauzanensis TaxID=653930 RepID=UPI0035261535
MHTTVAACQTTALDIALGHVPVMAGRIDAQCRLCFANPPLATTLGYSSITCTDPFMPTALIQPE